MTNIDARLGARGSGLAQLHAQMPIARRLHFWRWTSAVVLLALLASPFIGELLARLGAGVLAADRSEPCSWEER